MYVLLNVGGQVEVDDVLDVRDVETTSGNLKKIRKCRNYVKRGLL